MQQFYCVFQYCSVMTLFQEYSIYKVHWDNVFIKNYFYSIECTSVWFSFLTSSKNTWHETKKTWQTRLVAVWYMYINYNKILCVTFEV